MSCEIGGGGRKHVLLFPYPAQGHMLPMIDLADQLARRGLDLTILVTPKNAEILNPLLSVHPGIRTLVLPFPGHPKISQGVENLKDIGNHGNVPMMNAMGKFRVGIVEWFKGQEDSIRPVAIVSDFFLGWTERVAKEVGVPRIAFYSLSVLLMEVSYYSWKEIDHVLSLDTVEFEELPGRPVFKNEHLPSMVRRYNKSDPDWKFVKDSMTEGSTSWGLIFNSFHDLEGHYLDHCREKMEHHKVWAVGPLKLMNKPGKTTTLAGPRSDVLKWLDECPDRSVVYVCFGSQKTLGREQMKALATGLELSGSRFLWAVKQATTEAQMEEGFGSVPQGFEERVGNRGKVVRGWVSQEAVLNHRAVAYFLSHCGWNSVLEAVVGGVGLVAWPMEADQFVNAKILVEEMGVAVRVCEGADTVPDPNTLARTIAEALSGDQSLLSRAKDLSEKAHKAAGAGGSSAADLDRLVEDLKQLKNK
ncbi:hypothetical protein QQ045_005460 [Rhodiola kirilowii]